MDKIREEFEKERNISHDGGSLSYIIFQSGYHSGCKSRDEEIRELRKAVKEFLGWWSINNDTFLVVIKNLQEALKDGE